ncbi:hypothetical protein [Halococcoides cellulosivorans]|uniref:EF-hand domain-containing protein n=1 Tax=Halococcoides cellulosivorans TaxID=1679096 RepID=A0A2R4X1R9_9EURY|nr:hypothetical protein [Halococcoides cellulosivorans]AWB27718.1 hypothetical protein HARCEL1_08350 [Halococcoides cellulosivorans]
MASQGPRRSDGREQRYTRRRVVAGLGTGALVGIGAVGAASASQWATHEEWVDRAPWDVWTEGITDGTVTWNRSTGEPPDESLSVSFDGDRVTIDVFVKRTDLYCYELLPRRVIAGDRLGIVLDLATESDAEPCPGDDGVHYKIDLTPTNPVDTVIVDERFTDVTRSEPGRTRFDRAPRLTIPDGVTDYELTLDNGSFDYTDDPTITVDGSTVFVEGALVYGSSSCNTIRLTEIVRDGDRLDVTVGATHEPLYMPGQGCTEDLAISNYTLRLDLAETAGIDQLTVEEVGLEGTRTATATLDSDPDPIVDWTLEEDVDDVAAERRDDDPRVFFDGPEVIVEGLIGSSRCDEISAATELVGEGHLGVDVTATPSAEDCTLEYRPIPYRLTIQTSSEAAIDHVTAGELDGDERRDPRQTTARRPRVLDPIDSAHPSDLDGDGLHEDLTGDGTLGFTDVNCFFQHTDSPAVTDHADAYDFDGDGAVDLQDVLTVFGQI